MTFVRPQLPHKDALQPSWTSTLGAASEQSGREIEALSRALHRIGQEWAFVLGARVLLLALTLALSHGIAPFASLLPQLALGGWLACDLAIVALHRVARFAAIAPNRRLAIVAGLIGLSSLTFGFAAALALHGAADALLLMATLAPMMLALALFGELRALGIPLGVGGILGQAATLPDPMTLVPAKMLVIGLGCLLLYKHRAAARALAGRSEDAVLDGDQARALLEEFEKSGHGWFWETDRAGNITYISATIAAQMRRKPIDLIGKPFDNLIAASGSDGENESQRTLGFHFSARTGFSDIAVRAALKAEERWWAISGQPVVTSFGQFLGFRGTGSDLTEMRRSQAEVARLATVDSLTGLANRPQMMTTLEQALAVRPGLVGDCALFLLDLDRFKEVNDSMGHPAGDALLRQVAQRLTRLIGTQGKVGRIGGDEFKVVLPGMIEMMALAKLADNIIFHLSEPYSIDGSQVVIGASIGIALAPADGTTSETLIRNADLALYTAKGDGRGQFRFFMPAMHKEAEDRRLLENELRQAIATGGLHLEYQPVVCAASERITGFESLIRWNHPVRGPISPAVFIPIAEEAGLIGAIGEWVLRTACADARSWPKGTRVAVNVSPIQFANPALPNIVMNALANGGLHPAQLELEITESVFLADRDNTDAMFGHLKKLGIRLALDDFGTGYSALGYLKTAPFDKIKIDQSFVRGAAIRGSRNGAIVKSIVNLAEALGMETTAEGAETLDELDLIRSLGCSHIQGFVYGRPMSIEATHKLLAEHRGHAVAKGHKSSRESRMTMLRTVTLICGSNSYTARIRNISSSGVLVEGMTDVPAGTSFIIEFNDNLRVSGTCRWSQDERMGLEFEAPVSVEQIRAADKLTAAMKAAAHPVAYRRTG